MHQAALHFCSTIYIYIYIYILFPTSIGVRRRRQKDTKTWYCLNMKKCQSCELLGSVLFRSGLKSQRSGIRRKSLKKTMDTWKYKIRFSRGPLDDWKLCATSFKTYFAQQRESVGDVATWKGASNNITRCGWSYLLLYKLADWGKINVTQSKLP